MASYNFSREPKEVKIISTKNREIKTKIPAPGTIEILEKLDKYESRSMHGQLPIVWDKAIDYNVFDHLGNKWIDFTSMIFVANTGHGNNHVISKVEEALNKPMLGCYAYPNDIRANYLERLVKFAGPNFEKAFLLSAGTETTEAAFKLMKMNGQRIGKKRTLLLQHPEIGTGAHLQHRCSPTIKLKRLGPITSRKILFTYHFLIPGS